MFRDKEHENNFAAEEMKNVDYLINMDIQDGQDLSTDDVDIIRRGLSTTNRQHTNHSRVWERTQQSQAPSRVS